ncbi:hypothetical protein, partial [Verrucomicrobium spinosum]|uniref:hypothetical protein n=1 Tax=Verrucomicrobium spinosum TaxID=2736 RepID=UPI001C44DB25
MNLQRLRYCFHRFCAEPIIIAWMLGALITWAPLMIWLAGHGVIELLSSDWTAVVLLLICLLALWPVGYVVAVGFMGRRIMRACERWNGGPYRLGERVMILSGPWSGRGAFIHEKSVARLGGLPGLMILQP